MHKKLPVFLLAIALAVAAGAVQALGFGNTVNPTAIGRPLDFVAVVRVAPEETLEPGCVSAEVLSGDQPVAPLDVHVALQGAAGSAERRIRVTTRRAIEEPVVTVTVTVGCGARISRSFVAFLDPPLDTLARARSDQPAGDGMPSVSSGDSLLAAAQPSLTGERSQGTAAGTTKATTPSSPPIPTTCSRRTCRSSKNSRPWSPATPGVRSPFAQRAVRQSPNP